MQCVSGNRILFHCIMYSNVSGVNLNSTDVIPHNV